MIKTRLKRYKGPDTGVITSINTPTQSMRTEPINEIKRVHSGLDRAIVEECHASDDRRKRARVG